MYTLKLVLQVILLPPNSLAILAVFGWVWRHRRAGRVMLALALGLFLLLSVPVTGRWLVDAIPRYPALSTTALARTQAIVLLSGGLYASAPEYGGEDTISPTTLFRARYAARLHRLGGQPILVVGERVIPGDTTEAEIAARVLRREWAVPVRWVVGAGRDTIESAAEAAAVLLPEGIGRIALVTSDVHMGRALIAFEQAGFDVSPAPTGLWSEREYGIRDVVPSAGGMSTSSYALREWLGRLWTWAVG